MKKLVLFIIVLWIAPLNAKELPMVFQSVFPEGSETISGFGQLAVGYGSSTIRPVGGTDFESTISGGLSFAKVMEVTAFYSHFFSESWQDNAFAAGGEVTVTALQPHGAVPGLAFGLMGYRDQQGDGAITGRVSLFFNPKPVYALVTTYVEKAFGPDRDPVDLVVTAALGGYITPVLRMSLEYAAQDMEDVWEAEEAEGGLRQFLGVNLGWIALNNMELIAGVGTDMSFKQPKPLARFILRYSF